MGEKTFELRDKETGFYDDETRLDISRGQQVKIDPSKAGTKTLQMIQSRGLIEVGRESKASSKSASTGGDSDALPEDFPGRDKLIAGGFSTRSAVNSASDEELTALEGVGAKTVEHIRDYK